MNRGNVYDSQGRWQEAIACYGQSLEIKRALGDRHGEGKTLANLGNVYEQQDKPEQATECWQEALTKLHPDSPARQTVVGWLHNIQ